MQCEIRLLRHREPPPQIEIRHPGESRDPDLRALWNPCRSLARGGPLDPGLRRDDAEKIVAGGGTAGRFLSFFSCAIMKCMIMGADRSEVSHPLQSSICRTRKGIFRNLLWPLLMTALIVAINSPNWLPRSTACVQRNALTGLWRLRSSLRRMTGSEPFTPCRTAASGSRNRFGPGNLVSRFRKFN